MPARKRSATPASPETVARVVREFQASGMNSVAEAERLLDRIGVRDLSRPEAVVAISDSACHAVRDVMSHSPAVARTLLERACESRPPDIADLTSAEKIAYLWLAQTAGHAVKGISSQDNDAADIIRAVADMPLNCDPFGTGVLRKELLAHPACPPDVLYQAAVTWPMKDARAVAHHPNAPNEARIALALRS